MSVWYTLNVAGTDYPAEYYNIITYSSLSTVYATYTFPGLTVTQFTPGEEVTVVCFPVKMGGLMSRIGVCNLRDRRARFRIILE